MNQIAFTAVSLAVASAVSVGGGNLLAASKPTSFITARQPALSQTVVIASEKPKTQTVPPAPAPVMVTVSEGDTLSAIAETHTTTYVRVFNANEAIANPNVINPGQELRIPEASEQLPDRGLPQPAPIVASAPAVAAAPAATRSYSSASYPAVSGNDAKAFIYSRESGNNPNATNPSGCYGLGQDCNGRLRAACGADYACQDAYFTNYATGRYGSWDGAYAFWQTHGWW